MTDFSFVLDKMNSGCKSDELSVGNVLFFGSDCTTTLRFVYWLLLNDVYMLFVVYVNGKFALVGCTVLGFQLVMDKMKSRCK